MGLLNFTLWRVKPRRHTARQNVEMWIPFPVDDSNSALCSLSGRVQELLHERMGCSMVDNQIGRRRDALPLPAFHVASLLEELPHCLDPLRSDLHRSHS